jgi:Lrp/AsnC family leucine-responsive transcriptional regulator
MIKESQQDHEIVKLDPIDKKILKYLQQDGKASLRAISKEISSNVSTVKKHLDKLLEKDVILDFVARVNCCKIGYREMVLISIRVNNSVKIQEICESLEKFVEINAIYQVSGSFPLFCFAKCVEKMDQIELLERIKMVNGIEEISTQVVLQRIKEDMRVRIPE